MGSEECSVLFICFQMRVNPLKTLFGCNAFVNCMANDQAGIFKPQCVKVMPFSASITELHFELHTLDCFSSDISFESASVFENLDDHPGLIFREMDCSANSICQGQCDKL